MVSRLIRYLLMGSVLGIFYILLSTHFLFFGFQDVDDLAWLKKQELTLKNTFCSVAQQSPEAILRIDELRGAGIGELMVERGLLSSDKLRQILWKIELQQ